MSSKTTPIVDTNVSPSRGKRGYGGYERRDITELEDFEHNNHIVRRDNVPERENNAMPCRKFMDPNDSSYTIGIVEV